MNKHREMLYKDRVVDIVEVKGGWTTILDGMAQLKVRNGELRPLDMENPEVQAEVEAKVAKAALVNPDMSRYLEHRDVPTASGRASVDICDEVAAQLRGVPLERAFSIVADKLGVDVALLQRRYSNLNPGMKRMNLGNLLRGHYSKMAAEKVKKG